MEDNIFEELAKDHLQSDEYLIHSVGKVGSAAAILSMMLGVLFITTTIYNFTDYAARGNWGILIFFGVSGVLLLFPFIFARKNKNKYFYFITSKRLCISDKKGIREIPLEMIYSAVVRVSKRKQGKSVQSIVVRMKNGKAFSLRPYGGKKDVEGMCQELINAMRQRRLWLIDAGILHEPK